MPNVQYHNLPPATSNEQFTFVWWLTRVMKAAGWRYKASSDGTSKDTTGNPANDKWGGGQQVGSQNGTAALTLTNATSFQFGGRTTVSGMTGGAFATSSVGHFLTITGASNSGNNGTFLITKYISATSVEVENPAAIAETTAGTATWKETSAMLDTYAAIGANLPTGAWICLQGPSTIKVPMGSATPGFIKGENVTQASSGATAEVIGVYTDSVNGGYLVLSPRLSGISSGVRGWNNVSNIVGSVSGAVVSPTGTLLEYVREVVLWKNSLTNGHMYWQAIESITEATTTATTGRFSTMAALATCTATLCPGGATGGSPLTNGFPTVGTFACFGTGGSNLASTGSSGWFGSSTSTTNGVAQIMCANMIEGQNASADGSLVLAIGVPASSNQAFLGMSMQRLDDQEDGDLDPYVWAIPFSGGNFARSRTGNGNSSSTSDFFNSTWWSLSSTFLGHRRRGFPTGDTFSEFLGCALMNFSGVAAYGANIAARDMVACAFTNIPIREPIMVAHNGATNGVTAKTRKGTCRWAYWMVGGNALITYDSRKWIQLSSSNYTVVCGPADGTTIPLSQ